MTIYLYVKTHNVTGLKYFGKTTRPDPHSYRGSGKYWIKHLKKHGNNVATEIIGVFEDEVACTDAAIAFSRDNNIVESDLWANLQEENGVDGAPKGHVGHKFTTEELERLSLISQERWSDPEFRSKITEAQKQSWTEERRRTQSQRLSGVKRPDQSALMKSRPTHERFRCPHRSEKHKANIAKALKDKPKSPEHIKNLSKPKTRICRIHDRKEMSVNAYSRWLKSLLVDEIRI